MNRYFEFRDAAQQAAAWLDESTHVLIGAGAGLSVAAGIDYTDEGDFAQRFPQLLKYGVRARYQMIGFSGLSLPEFWGYWAAHVHDIRFTDRPAAVYQQLRTLVAKKNTFVQTSNVDAMFARNGFDPSRVCAIQGDYAFMQCLRPCRPVVWPSLPTISELLAHRDAVSGAIDSVQALPGCPNCGGPVFLNVRGGRWFVDAPEVQRFAELRAWIDALDDDARVVVFDIGSGFNTPSVVRWPMEQLAAGFRNARLVRINPDAPEVPRELMTRALGIPSGAAETIAAIAELAR